VEEASPLRLLLRELISVALIGSVADRVVACGSAGAAVAACTSVVVGLAAAMLESGSMRAAVGSGEREGRVLVSARDGLRSKKRKLRVSKRPVSSTVRRIASHSLLLDGELM
jgi:hypothetical protein